MKVLVIGDTHAPFHHKNYLKFLCDVRDEYKPDMVIHIGDLVDNHALSNYIKDPDGFSASDEWRATTAALKDFYKEFPEVTWIIGNHDRRPYRKAYDAGMSPSMVKPLNEIYDCPPTWNIVPEIVVEDVLYTHGEGGGGQNGWQNLCIKQGKSVAFGHFHGVGGVRYWQNKFKEQKFSLAVGCGVDEEAYAMAYGKNTPNRPMLGCGLVTDGWRAEFRAMNLKTRRYKGYNTGI